ncbi:MULTISPECIES: hypothetical protein [Corynebacterium]|nr:hypothetical protein [Corynebacterium hadale]WKC60815.1 hypothetical protein CHAD_09810 [Corynebacterium hadale]
MSIVTITIMLSLAVTAAAALGNLIGGLTLLALLTAPQRKDT